MTAAAIDYVWQIIRESERSDEIRFMDDILLIKAETTRLRQPRSNQSSAAGNESITDVAISPKLVAIDSLQTVTLPLVPRP